MMIATITLMDGTKYLFAVLCFLSAGAGTYFQLLGSDMFARALPPDRLTFPTNYHQDHTLEDVLARGRRWRDAAVGSKVSRLGALTLYLSVATGLVINFPSPVLAGIGIIACIGVITRGLLLLRGVPGLDRRVRLFERLQKLTSMQHGNVVAQIATKEYDQALQLSDAELHRRETLLEKMFREEEAIIAKRKSDGERQSRNSAPRGGEEPLPNMRPQT